ncbi:unnamed protein product, partial [Polarella glacialis]
GATGPDETGKEEIIQTGFKRRPIRDGGGKPSPGRRAPPKRALTALAAVGTAIMNACPSAAHDIMASLARQDTDMLFKAAMMDTIRQLMCKGSWEIAKGQRFYLDLMTHTARKANNIDSEYPQELKGLPDALCGLRWLHEHGQEPWWLPPEHTPHAIGASGPEGIWDAEEWVLLKADVTKAYRRVKISRKGWEYQIAIIKGKLAALMLRMLCYMFPSMDWAFVYVDDFAFFIQRRWANSLAWALLAALAALGCPLFWEKIIMGLVNTWLGFQIQTTLPAAAVGHLKHKVMVSLLIGIADGKLHSHDQIAGGLGCLPWATNAFPVVKPFLQPFWSWKTAVKRAGKPSSLLRMIARVILLLIISVITSTLPFCPTSLTHGATDAGADDTTAIVGGWFS